MGKDAMRWPGIKAKIWPVTVLTLRGPWRVWGYIGGNEYHGNWWCLNVGPWLILGGRGQYDA